MFHVFHTSRGPPECDPWTVHWKYNLSTAIPWLTWKWQGNNWLKYTFLLFENLIITLQNSLSICFWRNPWFVPDSSKLDSAHLSYQQGFVVQFPRNTRSSEVVCNLNFTWPLKSQVFSAFEPVEQIGKLCSPAKNMPRPGFWSEKSLPSERC